MDSIEVKADGTMLRDAAFCRAVIGVLMMRYANVEPVVVTQEDLNRIAGLAVLEGRTTDGNFMVGLGRKKGVLS